jgi:hypothetical protein
VKWKAAQAWQLFRVLQTVWRVASMSRRVVLTHHNRQ